MSVEWYCRIDGTDFGPVTAGDLKRMAAGGRLGPTDLVRKGDGKWVPAKAVKGLTFPAPAAADPEPTPPEPASAGRPCPACGSAGPAGRVLCIDCGYDFRTRKRRPQAGREPGRRALILAGGSAVLLLAAGVVAYLVASRPGTKPGGPPVAERPSVAGQPARKEPPPSAPGPKSPDTAPASVGVIAAHAPEDDASKKDHDQMQGTWRLVGLTIFGVEVPADQVQREGAGLVITKDNYAVRGNGEGDSGKIKLDASKTPKVIDFTIDKGDRKGQVEQAIYKLEGQRLVICRPSGEAKERPADFDAKKNKTTVLLIYERDIVARDAPGNAKAQADDPEAIRREVRDLLSGAKTSAADSIEARRKRLASLPKEAIDEWTAALKSSRDEAFTLLMNYDRLYTDNTFQKAESDRIRRLYEGSK